MTDSSPNPGGVKIAILFGAVAALTGATVYSFYQVHKIQMELVETRELLATQIAGMQETSTVTTETSKRSIEAFKSEVDKARAEASQLAGDARVAATKHADDLAYKLERMQEEQAAKVAQSVTQVEAQVSEVKQETNANKQSVTEVSGDLAKVKTQAEQTKAELEKTIADLKSTQGDLGVQSGLIATNARELSALRQLGERNYVEFNVRKTKDSQKVGDMMVKLKKADVKNNRYTVEVILDDKRVEKKDKTVNEPVQFLTAGSRFPYELVVNEVRKDQIIGYVSVPKVQQSRNN
jgi:chromosome segregation ATPase